MKKMKLMKNSSQYLNHLFLITAATVGLSQAALAATVTYDMKGAVFTRNVEMGQSDFPQMSMCDSTQATSAKAVVNCLTIDHLDYTLTLRSGHVRKASAFSSSPGEFVVGTETTSVKIGTESINHLENLMRLAAHNNRVLHIAYDTQTNQIFYGLDNDTLVPVKYL